MEGPAVEARSGEEEASMSSAPAETVTPISRPRSVSRTLWALDSIL